MEAIQGENGEEWQLHFLTKHLLVYAEVQCVIPETYLTGNYWAKAKAKET